MNNETEYPKGHELNPIHQSELHYLVSKVHYVPKGKNTIWAKTLFGTAIHNAIRDIAVNLKRTQHFANYFHNALADARKQGKVIIYTRNDYRKNAKAKRHAQLLKQGEKILAGLCRTVNFNKLAISNVEAEFKALFKPLNIWLAGTADIIVYVEPREQHKRQQPNIADFYPTLAQPIQKFYNFNAPEAIIQLISEKKRPDTQNRLIPCILDWKTSINPTNPNFTVQHWVYAFAMSEGFWHYSEFPQETQHETPKKWNDFTKITNYNFFSPIYYIDIYPLVRQKNITFTYAFGQNTLKQAKSMVSDVLYNLLIQHLSAT